MIETKRFKAITGDSIFLKGEELFEDDFIYKVDGVSIRPDIFKIGSIGLVDGSTPAIKIYINKMGFVYTLDQLKLYFPSRETVDAEIKRLAADRAIPKERIAFDVPADVLQAFSTRTTQQDINRDEMIIKLMTGYANFKKDLK